MTSIRPAAAGDVEQCVAVLARLPDYFTPDTHDEARRGLSDQAARAWVAEGDQEIVGFVLVERRYPEAAEITFAAVVRERQGAGVGTELVDTALAALAADGVAIVEVKTLDASAEYAPYVATRAFWERRGFRQIDCIDPLPGWPPGNPSAIYVAALSPTRVGRTPEPVAPCVGGGRRTRNPEGKAMPLSSYRVNASIAVSDIQQAVAFYEGKLGLPVVESGPSAHIPDASRIYGSGGGPALNVYQSETAGKSQATLAVWYVDDIDQVVDELTAAGVEFVRYEAFEADEKGIAPRAGGGRIAWFQDPDGNTFAIEADA